MITDEEMAEGATTGVRVATGTGEKETTMVEGITTTATDTRAEVAGNPIHIRNRLRLSTPGIGRSTIA